MSEPLKKYSVFDMTPQAAAAIARRLYVTGPALWRRMQYWRPYICPFGDLAGLVPSGARLLDVGCGGGLFLGILAYVCRIRGGIGFDSNAAAIALARTMTLQLPACHGLVFERLSVEDPWPYGTFDVVSMIDVMHHVPPADQPGLFAAAVTHVVPGGLLIYKDIAPVPRWRAFANRLHDLLLTRQWVQYGAAGQIERWAGAQGLALVSRRRIDMLWYGHDLAVFRKPVAGN